MTDSLGSVLPSVTPQSTSWGQRIAGETLYYSPPNQGQDMAESGSKDDCTSGVCHSYKLL